MNPDAHKTAPRCPYHRSPMAATGEQRDGRDVFRCTVIMGRERCSFENHRPIGFVPKPADGDAEL